MSFNRLARSGLSAMRAARPSMPLARVPRRTYADAVDTLKLSLTLPHQTIYKATGVTQVNIPAASGDMGVLSNHVPSIEQLRPGLIEIVEENGSTKQLFTAGGFAVMQPNNEFSINSSEIFGLEEFSAENIRALIAESQKTASGNGSEQDIAEAKVELEVLETLQSLVK
ncbi:hypothetical protein N7499_007645 [Penicillium canescens]|uniref:ATP synthase subunit delta, mitochondrial n=1 Tax=Penicillium canescens TaxID=5083 RepID=A0AAD6IFU6_PENCN|nr:uncharacterized protein N7446_003342 [Penicillium canescens]KAJ5996039.1 hypothetical protein N7522_007699 [Penicillium canescens]KAJ6045140.1 hypothetical protein N7460_006495 [Penicillium canescens]KAJ6056610.1 hypothetical protein N7444_005708 [Penicillium canescens]KAJ6075565.1 hypothetical protein N7446_003342 [Penicillium canescens]KAJ6082771.1 hypothetical protein N7499_007645 [Penicillium canescens]